MAINRNNTAKTLDGVAGVGPENLALSLLLKRYCLEVFMDEPVAVEQGSVAFAAGTDTNRIIVTSGLGNRFEYQFKGTGSDTFVPILASEGGWNWALGNTVVDAGVRVNFGGQKVGHYRTYRPASEDFFARVLLNTEDASGINAFFGLQDVGTIPAGFTDSTNLIGIRILGNTASTDAVIRAESNLGNSGSTEPVTSTLEVTLEEPTEVELEIRVRAMSVSFLVNGISRVTSGLTTTFTSTPKVTPCADFTQTTDLSTAVTTRAFECGPLKDRYPGSLRSLLTSIGVAAAT